MREGVPVDWVRQSSENGPEKSFKVLKGFISMFWPLWISATASALLGLDHSNNPVDGWVNYKKRWVNYKERWVNYLFRWVNYKKPPV